MFNFDYILDGTTGIKYAIVAAQLANNSADYAKAPDGFNVYEIDLEPTNTDGKSIYGLTLFVSADNDWAMVQKGLEPKSEHEASQSSTIKINMMHADIQGNMLVTPADSPETTQAAMVQRIIETVQNITSQKDKMQKLSITKLDKFETALNDFEDEWKYAPAIQEE